MKLLNLQQNSEEWNNWRKSNIGSSDAASILNVNPWKSAQTLWLQKLNIVAEDECNLSMIRGIELEPIARKLYEKEVKIPFSPVVMQSCEHDFIIASLDGYNHELRKAIEIKCCGKTQHKQFIKGKVPKHYVAQLQHQMYVAELDEITLLAYNPQEEIEILSLKIIRDDLFIKDLIEKEIKFKYCLENFISPEDYCK